MLSGWFFWEWNIVKRINREANVTEVCVGIPVCVDSFQDIQRSPTPLVPAEENHAGGGVWGKFKNGWEPFRCFQLKPHWKLVRVIPAELLFIFLLRSYWENK